MLRLLASAVISVLLLAVYIPASVDAGCVIKDATGKIIERNDCHGLIIPVNGSFIYAPLGPDGFTYKESYASDYWPIVYYTDTACQSVPHFPSTQGNFPHTLLEHVQMVFQGYLYFASEHNRIVAHYAESPVVHSYFEGVGGPCEPVHWYTEGVVYAPIEWLAISTVGVAPFKMQ